MYISFPSRTLINEVGKETPFTVTSNLKNHISITSKVNAKCSDNNPTDKEYIYRKQYGEVSVSVLGFS